MVAVLYVLVVFGFQPLVVVSLILPIITRTDFGLAKEPVSAAILCAWGLSKVISPFSGPSLLLGGLLQTSSFTFSFRWNWKFALAGTLAMFGVVYLAA